MLGFLTLLAPGSNIQMRIVGLGSISLAILFTGCDGGGGGSAPTTPVLRNAEYRVAVGDSHSIALDANGNIWSWGANYAGQLGNRTTEPSTKPIAVFGLNGVAAVSASSVQSLALKADGTVWSWGQNSLGYSGGITDANVIPILCAPGYPLTANVTAPNQVAGLDHVVQISAGLLYAVALRSDGTVWTWGSNSNGQLGTGETADQVCLPTQVAGLGGITAVTAGRTYVLALKSDGTVWSWGDNRAGGLGNGTLVSSNVPLQVPGLSGIIRITASDHSAALDSAGTVWIWGGNSSGQVGDDSAQENCAQPIILSLTQLCVKSPVKLDGLPAIAKIVAGTGVTYAIDRNDVVWGWGNSNQLGTTQSTSTCSVVRVSWPCVRFPLVLPHLAGFSFIPAGAAGSHTLSVKADGSLWGWGSNGNGQLGNGNTTDSLPPVQVLDPSGQGGFNLDAQYGESPT